MSRNDEIHFRVERRLLDEAIEQLTQKGMDEHNAAISAETPAMQTEMRSRGDISHGVASRLRLAMHRAIEGAQGSFKNHGAITTGKNGHTSQVIMPDRFSLLAAIIGIGLAVWAISQLNQMTTIIDAKVQAGMAQAVRDMQGEVARANATAHTAETHARVALDRVEQQEIELGKKGVNIRPH